MCVLAPFGLGTTSKAVYNTDVIVGL
jgi:hypothetical protein